MEKFFCSYCGQEKPLDEQTGEHVIPQKIGGAVSPVNPFKLGTVCKRCNSTCGLFVDGPFLLNSLTHAHYALMSNDFVDVQSGAPMSLNYMGFWKPNEEVLEGYDCEIWLGPTGDHVFHFHKPYPKVEGTLGMVSLKMIKERDHGFVMVFITSNNPVWHPTIVKSVLGNFSSETLIYFANVGFSDQPKHPQIQLLDEEKKSLAEKIKAILEKNSNGPEMKVQQTLDIGFAERFQAKVALGFGSLFLNQSFQSSAYAKFLRDYLWTKTTEERKAFPLRGAGILSGQNVVGLIGNEHCVSVILLPVNNGIGLAINFFKQFEFSILISDDISHWPTTLDSSGIGLSLVSPLRACVGPLALMEFVGECLENNTNSRLKKMLTEAEKKKKPRPPYMIEG